MRQSSGSNDHPDSTVFLQLYRLLGTYSLIKPPKGSNVSGEELFSALVSTNDLKAEQKEGKENLHSILDRIISSGGDPNDLNTNDDQDHTYQAMKSSDWVLNYVAGFLARRMRSSTKCSACKESLINKNTDNIDREKLITIKNKGGLMKPSEALYNVVSHVEQSVLHIVSSQPITVDLLNDVLEHLGKSSSFPVIGGEEHMHHFTNTITQYYITLRMCFICRQENAIDAAKKKKTQKLRKISKLC